jgi:hypothetical protein
MSPDRSQQPTAESLPEHENSNDALSSLSSSILTVFSQTPSWPDSNEPNNGNPILGRSMVFGLIITSQRMGSLISPNLGNIREIEDTELSQNLNQSASVTETNMIDLPSDLPPANYQVWGPSNRPSSLEFTIYEDPPEHAALSVPTALAEGFHTMEEDKENLLVDPFGGYLSSSSSSNGEIHPYIDWSEAAHRPRDAFGVPVEYDGLVSTDQTLPDTERVYFRRGRHVLAPLAIPDAEDSDHEDGRASTQTESHSFEENEQIEEDDEEEL